MDKIFTITEHRLIRSLLANKTDDQISLILGCDKNDIMSYVAKLKGVGKRPETKPIKAKATKPISLKGLGKKSDKVDQQKKIKENQHRINRDHERHINRKKAESRSTFKTIPFTAEGKIKVRLNVKTEVWVKPGTDIDALKKKLRIN
jgi:hypothetical protein